MALAAIQGANQHVRHIWLYPWATAIHNKRYKHVHIAHLFETLLHLTERKLSLFAVTEKAPTHRPDSNQLPTAFIRPLCRF